MSFDLTVHEKSLRAVGLRKRDFVNYPLIQDPKKLQEVLVKSTEIANTGFSSIALAQSSISGKPTFKIRRLEDDLILRMISKNIRVLTKVRQSNRVSIVQCIRLLLEEGVDYHVYKLDIKSFYENIHIDQLIERLRNDSSFSRQSLSLLESFFGFMRSIGVSGLPRGIALSATLAEYLMRDFDKAVRLHREVFYYSRFVDDMILITSGREIPAELIRSLSSWLPSGLSFGSEKTKVIEFKEPIGNTGFCKSFDFLGYQFSVNHRTSNPKPIRRKVDVDISNSKTNKIKTRVVKSVLQFCSDGDFEALFDRVKLLSGNYSVYDHARGIKRKSGIYFNYRLVDEDSSKSLIALDDFLQKLFLSRNGRISSKLYKKISNKQRRQILGLSFKRGFRRRVFYNFSATRLVILMKCWRHE